MRDLPRPTRPDDHGRGVSGTADSPIWGAVLAGGASSRMGTDKALVEVGGIPMLAIGLRALVGGGASRVLVVGGDAQAYRTALPDVADVANVIAVPDDHPGDGPLGGVITALRQVPEVQKESMMVVLACDLPGVCASSVAAIVAAMKSNPTAQACVASQRGRMEPLHAVWRRSVLGRVEEAFASGERAVHRVLENIDAVVVEGLDESWLRNVNSPEELPR